MEKKRKKKREKEREAKLEIFRPTLRKIDKIIEARCR